MGLCAVYSLALACMQAGAIGLYWLTERWNAPWLPFWRRYLSVWPLVLAIVVSVRTSTPWLLVLSAPVILNWNTLTAHRNRRGGKRPKPGPSLGAALTAVQAGVMQREARACR